VQYWSFGSTGFMHCHQNCSGFSTGSAPGAVSPGKGSHWKNPWFGPWGLGLRFFEGLAGVGGRWLTVGACGACVVAAGCAGDVAAGGAGVVGAGGAGVVGAGGAGVVGASDAGVVGTVDTGVSGPAVAMFVAVEGLASAAVGVANTAATTAPPNSAVSFGFI
jgi:hypothetical protein